MPTIITDFQPATADSRTACPPADQAAMSRVSESLSQLEQLAAELAEANECTPTVPYVFLPANFVLSVVIPVYNEQATIRQVIQNVVALPVEKEIIVVDDASTDGTRQELAECEKTPGVSVIYKPHNEGKGAALRTA